MLKNETQIEIDYTNWRGERSKRIINPIGLVLESNEWHRETQWLLVAKDVARGEMRKFAMKDIHSWTPKEQPK